MKETEARPAPSLPFPNDEINPQKLLLLGVLYTIRRCWQLLLRHILLSNNEKSNLNFNRKYVVTIRIQRHICDDHGIDVYVFSQ
mgnify:CR=1 FL=1